MSPLGPQQIAELGFEKVVDDAPLAIAVIDTSGRVIHTNGRARELTVLQLGHEMPAALDGAIDIFHLDGRRYERHEWPAVRSLMSGEVITDEEFFYALPEDRRLFVRCSSSPVRDEDGEIVAAVLAMADVTESREAAEHLAFHASLLDLVEEAVIGTDAEFRLTVWNRGAEQLYGYAAEEVLGRDVREIGSPPGDVSRAELHRELLVADGTRAEITAYRKDGTPVDVEVIVLAMRDERGRIAGFIGTHRDVSERRRAMRELQESQRLVETILNRITDAFVAVDCDWRYTYVNDLALARMQARKGTALRREEVIGRNMWEMFPEAIGTELQRRYEQAMRDGRPAFFETFFEYSGEWIEAHAYPSDTGLSIYYRDVSASRRAEAALHEARRLNEAVLESITDAFYALDRSWRLTYANAQAVRFASQLIRRELTRDEVLGQTLWELLPGTVGSSLDDQYRRAVREQVPVLFEYRYPGSKSWFEVHAYPSEQGLAVYFQEITDRRAAERERELRSHQQAAIADLGLRALADEDTSDVVREATAVVAAMLHVDLAGVADRLPTGELLLRAGVGWMEGSIGVAAGAPGGVSLAGYTLLVGGPIVSDDIGADVRFTPSALLRQHGVVSAVTAIVQGRNRHFGVLGAFSRSARSFSREDVAFVQSVANVVAVALERADVEERVREVREAERRRMARALHDEALQDLSLALASAAGIAEHRPPSEAADEIVPALARVAEHLRAAIYDLRLGEEEHRPFSELLADLVATHRASVPYDIKLRVRAGTPARSLGTPGIEVLRIIGEALSNARRHAAPSRVTVTAGGSEDLVWCEVADDGRGIADAAGQGTGLAGMRERAALISADLTIVSRAGTGTAVRIELSLREPVETAEGPVRIVLVEDHAAVRQALASVLGQAGFRVVGQAGSLTEARQMLREANGEIDVAVLDLVLPDGFGADLIDELRRSHPGAQALALSASLDRGEIARAVDRGVAAVLPKSAPLREILRAVRRLRAGEALLPPSEVVDLLRFARSEHDRRHADLAIITELTPREREVLQLLADGLSSEEVAARLHIARSTQRNHVTSILAKLRVHSQLQAVMLALRYGVVHL